MASKVKLFLFFNLRTCSGVNQFSFNRRPYSSISPSTLTNIIKPVLLSKMLIVFLLMSKVFYLDFLFLFNFH